MSDIITWNILPEVSWGQQAQAQIDAIEADIVSLIDGMTDEVTAHMRAEHRWQNVTGETEAGLYSDIEHVARESVYLLMSYGPTAFWAWKLEANPKFSFLSDVSDHFWPVLYRGAQEIVRRHSS